MKINKLMVQNFRNHKQTEIFLDKVNFFVGRNNAGKSSLLAAIEWGLTGKCLWTDKAGRGAAELVSKGAKQAAVGLEVAGIGGIVRTMPPHTLQVGSISGVNEGQAAILNRLAADEDRLKIALNAAAFLNLSASEQLSFLFGAFGLQFTADKVAQQLEVWLKSNGQPGERARALAARAKGYYPAGITGGPEVLDVMEKRAREIRRELKRDKQRAEAALAEMAATDILAAPADGRVEELRNRLAGLRHKREELLTAAGDPHLPARRETLVNRIKSLDEKIKAARDKAAELAESIKGLPDGNAGENCYSQREKEILDSIEVFNTRAASLKSRAASLTSRLDTLTGAARALAGVDRRCPLAPEVIKCGMSKAQVEGILQQLNQERQAARDELAGIKQELLQIDDQLNRAGQKLDELKKNQAAALEQARKLLLLKGELNTQQVLINQLTTDRDNLARELAGLPEPGQEAAETAGELQQLAELMADIETQLVQAGEMAALARRQEELKQDIDTYTAEVADLELLVKSLGPDGLRRDILADVLGNFLNRVNHRLGRLTEGGYQLTLGADMTLLCRANGGPHLPLKLLSKSEQLRVGIAIQEALSHAAGLNFLAIDEADMLDQENRDLLTGMLLDLAEEYDQVLVFTTVGDVQPTNPGLAGVKLFWVEDGKVAEVD